MAEEVRDEAVLVPRAKCSCSVLRPDCHYCKGCKVWVIFLLVGRACLMSTPHIPAVLLATPASPQEYVDANKDQLKEEMHAEGGQAAAAAAGGGTAADGVVLAVGAEGAGAGVMTFFCQEGEAREVCAP